MRIQKYIYRCMYTCAQNSSGDDGEKKKDYVKNYASM